MGEIVHIDLPKVGDAFKQMDVFGAVESVKMASDIYSPVSGSIAKVLKFYFDWSNKYALIYMYIYDTIEIRWKLVYIRKLNKYIEQSSHYNVI